MDKRSCFRMLLFCIFVLCTIGGSKRIFADTYRVSVSSTGEEADYDSNQPAISGDGRYISFTSSASNLGPGITRKDIFVHDTQNGETTRASVGSNGERSDRYSQESDISSDGRYVTFWSLSTTLVPNDTNNVADIFHHDRETGETIRVSVSSDGVQSNQPCYSPRVSGNGQFVGFNTWASNLVDDDTNGLHDVFIHDCKNSETTRTSLSPDLDPNPNQPSYSAPISSDGRFVAFHSYATNLVPGDSGFDMDVFVYDRLLEQTNCVSVNPYDGAPTGGSNPDISSDGRFIVFEGYNSLPDDTNSYGDIHLHDRLTGETFIVSVNSQGEQANASCYFPRISGDGRFVIFQSGATNLATGDANGYNDLFLHDRITGQTIIVNVNPDGEQANGRLLGGYDISNDGRYIVFDSDASNLVPDDNNGVCDIFVHDRGPRIGPSVFQTPMYGPPGTIFTQRGSGFTQNSTVTLHFGNPLGQDLPTQQHPTDGLGEFEIVYESSTDTPEGTHTWWAVDDATGAPSKTLAYDIVINAGQSTSINLGQTQDVEQTSYNENFGTLLAQAGNSDFDPEKDTFVIVHGWNRTESTAIPGWVALMGADIANRSSAQGANVYYWNWQEEAKSPNPEANFINEIIPFGLVAKSGENLAKELNEILYYHPDYDRKIHFIGHSLGSGVIAFATKFIYENEGQFTFRENIAQLTMLDSPWILDRPGGSFLRDHKDNFFLDNYFSAFGKLTGYWEADANIYLIKSPSALYAIDIYGDPHGYSHEWYRSSVTNFSEPDILGDLITPPATMPYGFYWWDENNQHGAIPGYIQESVAPHWYLRSYASYIAAGTVVDTAYYTGEIAAETWAELNDFADRSGKKIKLLSVNTYNSVSDTTGYVKDQLSHAFHESLPCAGFTCGALRLEHHSASTVTAEIEIPALANAMTFGFDFQYADPGTIFEAFLEDQLLYRACSHDVAGKGYQMAPWIEISKFAGEQKALTFRMYNPVPETEGAMRVDDIIFARIENQLYGDADEDCDVDGYDLAEFISGYSGEELDTFALNFGNDCL